MNPGTGLKRRSFLKKAAAATLGAGLAARGEKGEAAQDANAGKGTPARMTVLKSYEAGCGTLCCRHACGVCEPACPYGVPVNTIMRYFQYFAAQGREREAMGYYAAIPGLRADLCAGCGGRCESACPYGVPIQGLLIAAHGQLTPA